jgi:4-aminobutyrate aminotransferase / (S)-3-amino-2-methylpropionate transaminase / 5-aminovalerate transaminase
VLGRGGVHVASRDVLASIVALTKQAGALVIDDEIWTGMGRCGSLLRFREIDLPADIVCIGKGLGGGLPISACIGSDSAMRAWGEHPGVLHTSTHAGAPIGCAAALATINALSEHRLSERAEIMGSRFRETLNGVLSAADGVVEVRGLGLMIGVELEDGALGLRVAGRMLRRGFVVTSGGRAGEVVVMTPPLVIGEALLSAAALALAESIAEE